MENKEVLRVVNELAFHKRKSVRNGLWKSRENRIAAVEMFFNAIPKKNEEEALLNIKAFQIRGSSIGGLFTSQYKGSILLLVKDVYPDKLYLFEERALRGSIDFKDIDECAKSMSNIASKLNVSIEKIGFTELRQFKSTYMLAFHTLVSIRERVVLRRDMSIKNMLSIDNSKQRKLV